MIHENKGFKRWKTQRSKAIDVHQPPTVIIEKNSVASYYGGESIKS